MSILKHLQEALLTELTLPKPNNYFPNGAGGGSFEVYDRKADETILVYVDVSINSKTNVLDIEFTVNGSFSSTDRGHGVGIQVIKGVAYVILETLKYTSTDIERIEFTSRENDGAIKGKNVNQREKLYKSLASYVAPQIKGWENWDVNTDYEVGTLKKPSQVNESIINEVTADDKYAKQYDGKLDREIFDKAVSLDPTSGGTERVGKYVDWLIKRSNIWGGHDLTNPLMIELSELLALFDKFNSKIPSENRDINTFKNIQPFTTYMKHLKNSGTFESKKDKKKAQKNIINKETEFVLKTDKYTIIKPLTQKSSQYWTMYGGGKEGCSWCTGAKNDASCHFGAYDDAGTLYIIFDSNDKDRKWQMIKADEGEELPNVEYEGNTGEYEYRDCSNDGFDPWEEFSDDTKVMEWMRTNDFPEYKVVNKITEEEVISAAHSLVNYTRHITSDKGKAEALDIYKSILEEKIGNYYYDDDDADQDIDLIESDISDGINGYEDILGELQYIYGIDASSEENILRGLWATEYGDQSVGEFLENYDEFLSEAVYKEKTKDIDVLLDRLGIDPNKEFVGWEYRRFVDKLLGWYGDLYDDITSTPKEIVFALKRNNIDVPDTLKNKIETIHSDKSETRKENPQQVLKYESVLREIGLI